MTFHSKHGETSILESHNSRVDRDKVRFLRQGITVWPHHGQVPASISDGAWTGCQRYSSASHSKSLCTVVAAGCWAPPAPPTSVGHLLTLHHQQRGCKCNHLHCCNPRQEKSDNIIGNWEVDWHAATKTPLFGIKAIPVLLLSTEVTSIFIHPSPPILQTSVTIFGLICFFSLYSIKSFLGCVMNFRGLQGRQLSAASLVDEQGA